MLYGIKKVTFPRQKEEEEKVFASARWWTTHAIGPLAMWLLLIITKEVEKFPSSSSLACPVTVERERRPPASLLKPLRGVLTLFSFSHLFKCLFYIYTCLSKHTCTRFWVVQSHWQTLTIAVYNNSSITLLVYIVSFQFIWIWIEFWKLGFKTSKVVLKPSQFR